MVRFEPVDPNYTPSPEVVAQIKKLLEGTKNMRDPERIERILDQIREVWLRPENQDMRLMQLLLNAMGDRPVNKFCGHVLYNLEDSELESDLRFHYLL